MTEAEVTIRTNEGDIPRSVYNLLQCYYALSIEVKTGLRHSRGSILSYVQRTYGVRSRTKKGAMKEIKVLLDEKGHDTSNMKEA